MNSKQVICDFEQMQTDQCYKFPFSFEFREKCLDQVPIPYLDLAFSPLYWADLHECYEYLECEKHLTTNFFLRTTTRYLW